MLEISKFENVCYVLGLCSKGKSADLFFSDSSKNNRYLPQRSIMEPLKYKWCLHLVHAGRYLVGRATEL